MVNKIDDKYECPFDIYLLKFIDTHLDMYYNIGLTPNMITTLGIIFGLLSMYNISLPRIVFHDAEEGEEVVALSQFGDKIGAKLDGTVTSLNTPDESEYYLYYSYGIGESGFYEFGRPEKASKFLPNWWKRIDRKSVV